MHAIGQKRFGVLCKRLFLCVICSCTPDFMPCVSFTEIEREQCIQAAEPKKCPVARQDGEKVQYRLVHCAHFPEHEGRMNVLCVELSGVPDEYRKAQSAEQRSWKLPSEVSHGMVCENFPSRKEAGLETLKARMVCRGISCFGMAVSDGGRRMFAHWKV